MKGWNRHRIVSCGGHYFEQFRTFRFYCFGARARLLLVQCSVFMNVQYSVDTLSMFWIWHVKVTGVSSIIYLFIFMFIFCKEWAIWHIRVCCQKSTLIVIVWDCTSHWTCNRVQYTLYCICKVFWILLLNFGDDTL
jgi:hypothetical protein